MTEMPTVSVVIPSYNHAAYIGEAVGSVLAQSLADLEVVVVDDGSRDNSLEVLAGIHDARLRVITQENRGAHAAITRGLHAAQGRYLAVLNSDDAYEPTRLEKLLRLFESNPQLVLAGSHIQIVDAQGKPLGIKHGYQDAEPWLLAHAERSFRAGESLRAALLTENYLATTSNYLFPRQVFERTGDLRPLRYAHDWDFALRLLQHGSLALLPEPLMRYRVHASNTIRENQAAMVFEICWILAVHLPQHIGTQALNAEMPQTAQTAGLLHSLYTFGCDAALAALLARRLDENEQLALSLLDPQNPERQVVLEYIRETLAAAPAPAVAAPPPAGMRRWIPGPLRRVLAALRRRIQAI